MKNILFCILASLQFSFQQTINFPYHTYLRTPSLDRSTVLTERLGGSFAYTTTEQLVYTHINNNNNNNYYNPVYIHTQFPNTYNPSILILIPGLKHEGVNFKPPPLYNGNPSTNMDFEINTPATTTELPVEIIDTGKSDLDSVNTNDIDEESVVIDSAAH